jgi:hypothetical protein
LFVCQQLQLRLQPPIGSNLILEILEDYDASEFHEGLKGILLSRHGIYIKTSCTKSISSSLEIYQEAPRIMDGGQLSPYYLGACKECSSVVCQQPTANEIKKYEYPPPVDAIANGHWVGYLPDKFKNFTRSDEQCLSLKQLVIYLSTISGSKTKICSHHYIIENPSPIITVLPGKVEGCVRLTLVGAFTSEVEASQRMRFVLQHELNKEYLETILFKKNVRYMGKEDMYDPLRFETIDRNVAILNRCEGTTIEVDPKLLRIVEFSNTLHNVSDGHSDKENEAEAVTTNSTNFIYEPKPGSDFLVHNTNILPKERSIDNLVDCCPFLYVYGRGGYIEPTRAVHMSEERYLMRCLRVSKGRFPTHPCFSAVAFDIIAHTYVSKSQFLSMKVSKKWIQNGIIDKSTVLKAVEYKNKVLACEKKAMKVLSQVFNTLLTCKSHNLFTICNLMYQRPEAPKEIKNLLDVLTSITPGMRAMVGSDDSAAAARQIAFGYQLRMGIASIFCTLSPDNAGTYFISIYSGKLSFDNLIHKIKLPTRSERRETAGKNPYLCAVYAKRVLDVFIEDFLGWDQQHGASKRGGGAFGVLRWFAGSAEAQVCHDIHFHILASIFGWPRTTAQYKESMKTEAFQIRYTTILTLCIYNSK